MYTAIQINSKNTRAEDSIQKLIDLVVVIFVSWDTAHKDYHDRNKKSQENKKFIRTACLTFDVASSAWRTFALRVSKLLRKGS